MKIFPLKLGLRQKLLIIIIGSLLFGLSTVGLLLYYQFRSYAYNQVYDQLKHNLSLAELLLDKDKVEEKDLDYLKDFVDRIKSILTCRATIIDGKGAVIADSEVPTEELRYVENHYQRPEVQESITEGWGYSLRRSATINEDLIYVCKSFTVGNERLNFIRFSFFAEKTNALLRSALLLFIAGIFLIVVISGLLVMFLSRTMNRNLDEIIQKAYRIADGDLYSKINVDSSDELSDLGNILNDMSKELSDSFHELTRQREDLNAVLSSIHDGIIAIGPKGRIMFNNEIALQMLGLSTKDVVGKSYADLLQNDHLISLVDRFFEKPFFLGDELKVSQNKILEVVINPFKVMDTPQIGAVIVLKDVSNFKKLEKIRRDFVANVSHEFKNPLASIIGYSESLLDWGLKDSNVNRKYLKKIVKQSRTLEHLVSDLLSLAKVEGMGEMEVKSFNPKIILKELKVDFSELAAAKKIDFKQDYDEPFPNICGDPEMFRTILANLIDNAIKYSSEGSEVTVSSTNENGHVKFSIVDKGIGIPPKYIDRIFERFFRVDKGRSKAVGGTGLGLSIVKHMADLQKAEYGVESEVNVGSKFWVKFRRA